MRNPIPVVLCSLLLAGCSIPHAIDYHAPASTIPTKWSGDPMVDHSVRSTADLREWWSSFNDPVLDRLIDRALADNIDLKIASQRLLAARAERDEIAAARSPRVGISGSSLLQRSSREVEWPHGIGVSNTQTLQLEASWEVDLFGRIRHAVEAADASIGVAEEDRRAVLISILSEIAINYIDLRTGQQRLVIAERNVFRLYESFETTARLNNAGLTNATSVALAKAEWQSAQAELPKWRAQISRHIHAIGVLLGGFPGDLQSDLEKGGDETVVVPLLPASVPSQMLRDRPDIRAAERRLAEAAANTNVAIADLFPRLRIPLTLGTASSGIGGLFTAASTIWSVAAVGSQTLFDAGQRKARIRVAQAVTEAQRLDYERSVRVAFRDVEDALTAIKEDSIRYSALVEAQKSHQTAVGRAIQERRAGTIGYLDLLIAQRSLYSAEDQVAASKADQLRDVVLLSKALGGGWQHVYPMETQSDETTVSSDRGSENTGQVTAHLRR
ncbi:efflux transporter outer membrane subunit [Cupriavidus metallidurans]|uniref:Efflux transporter outer membrane subunit n=1 Tax=Cupriavidus metallidurans TaxID=119219 RepID=A0A482IUF4_9BURK|nr:efflux transporter outer membrane subunit [Cupriavidus metallidurans]QBP12528.1 efflux transporter outer membrane subunit [Cupriavidus metallidurans]